MRRAHGCAGGDQRRPVDPRDANGPPLPTRAVNHIAMNVFNKTFETNSASRFR